MLGEPDYGLGQLLLEGFAEYEPSFESMEFWNDDVNRSFGELGLCWLDVAYVVKGIEDSYGLRLPDNVLERAKTPLELIYVVVTHLNERLAAT